MHGLSDKKTTRLACWLTVFIFTLTSVSDEAALWAQFSASTRIAERIKTHPEITQAPPFSIPPKLGVLESYEAFVAGLNKPFILHIRDAHANPHAQEKIRDLLNWVYTEVSSAGASGPMVIGLEGTVDTVHPEYLDFFPRYPEANEAVVNDLLRKGELHGVELFAWEHYRKNSRGFKIVGVEDPEIYRHNLLSYRTLLSRQDEIEMLLEPLRRKREVLKEETLSPVLRHFLREKQRRKYGDYQNGVNTPQLAAYLRYLSQTVKKEIGVDLEEPFEQIRFPNLKRVRTVQALEERNDAQKAREEKEEMLRLLREKDGDGSAKELVLLLEGLEESPDARAVVERVWEYARRKHIDLSPYRSYWSTAGSAVLRSELDVQGLFEEMEVLEGWLVERWVSSGEERALLQMIEDLEIVERLLKLEWTSRDYKKFHDRAEQIRKNLSLLNGAQSGESTLSGLIGQALLFYETARRRDEVMLERLLDALGEIQADVQAPPVAILIGGGFHTEGLTKHMKERGISFAVVRPHLEQAGDGGLYHKVMRGDHADVTPYFEKQILNKQEALFFKGLIEAASPTLWEEYGVPHSRIGPETAEAVNRHPVLGRRMRASAEESGDGSKAVFSFPASAPTASPSLSVESATVNIPALTESVSYYVDFEVLTPSFESTMTEIFFRPAGTKMTFRKQPQTRRSELRSDSNESDTSKQLETRSFELRPDSNESDTSKQLETRSFELRPDSDESDTSKQLETRSFELRPDSDESDTSKQLETRSFELRPDSDEVSRSTGDVRPLFGRVSPSEEMLGDWYYPFSIPLPGWAWLRRGIFFHWARAYQYVLSMGVEAGKAERVIERLALTAPLALRLRKDVLRFEITGWSRLWFEAWASEAQNNPDISQRIPEYYVALQFLLPNDEAYRDIEKSLQREYIPGRLSAYQKQGRTPPRIERIEIPYENQFIPAYLIMPPGIKAGEKVPVVQFYHGFTNRKENPYFDSLESELIAKGIAVLRADLLRHGENALPLASPRHVNRVLGAVLKYIEEHPGLDESRIGLYGFSFGGYMGLRALSSAPIGEKLKAVVAENPPVFDTFFRFRQLTGNRTYLEYIFQEKNLERLREQIELLALKRSHRRLRLLKERGDRLLVFSSGKDQVVSRKDFKWLRDFLLNFMEANGHPGRVRIYPKEGHYIFFNRSEVVRNAADHFTFLLTRRSGLRPDSFESGTREQLGPRRSELRTSGDFAEKQHARLAGHRNGDVKLIARILTEDPKTSLQDLANEFETTPGDTAFRQNILAYVDTVPKLNLHEHTSGLIHADDLLPYFLGDSEQSRKARRGFALTYLALSRKEKTALELQARPADPNSISQEEADRIFSDQIGFPDKSEEMMRASADRLKRFVTYRRDDRDWNAFESAFTYIKSVTDADPASRFELAKQGALRQFRSQHVRYLEVTDYHGTSIADFAESMGTLIEKLLEAESETNGELTVAALRAFRKDYPEVILEKAAKDTAWKETWTAPYRDMSYAETRNSILAAVIQTDTAHFALSESKIRREFEEAVEEIERQLARDGIVEEEARKERLILTYVARNKVYEETRQFVQGLNELEDRYPLYRKRMIGISSIGDEVDYINWVMTPLFRTAQKVGLKSSSHIGERWRPGEYVPALKRIKREIEAGVNRIAHATALGLDYDQIRDITPEARKTAKELQAEIFVLIKRNNVHVETLPTSNTRFSPAFSRYEDHVAVRFWKEKIAFSVHPDDSSVLDTSPTNEIAQLWFANPELPYDQIVLTVDQAYNAKFFHPVQETIDRLKREVAMVLEIHKQYPPKVGVYGSARIPPGHPQAVLAKGLGRELWKRRVAPMTGAGPGIMRFIIEGYLEAMQQAMEDAAKRYPGFHTEPQQSILPLGIRILLNKFEPAAEMKYFPIYNFRHFGPRKLALHVNILELISMHGGLGSLDEIFETLRRGRNVMLWDWGHLIWKKIFDTLEQMFIQHGLRSRIQYWPLISESLSEVLEPMLDPSVDLGYIPQLDERDVAIIESQVEDALRKLSAQPRAVTVIGHPADDSPELGLLGEITEDLLDRGITVRAASRGPVAETVLGSAAKSGRWKSFVQTVLFKAERDSGGWTKAEQNHANNFPDRAVHLSTSSGHQVVSSYDARAFLVLPGGWGTLNRLFDVLVAMQTGSIRRKPIVLIGESFWRPFLEVLRETMEGYDPPLISPGDIDIMQIARDKEQAIDLLHVNGKEAKRRSELRSDSNESDTREHLGTRRSDLRGFSAEELAMTQVAEMSAWQTISELRTMATRPELGDPHASFFIDVVSPDRARLFIGYGVHAALTTAGEEAKALFFRGHFRPDRVRGGETLPEMLAIKPPYLFEEGLMKEESGLFEDLVTLGRFLLRGGLPEKMTVILDEFQGLKRIYSAMSQRYGVSDGTVKLPLGELAALSVTLEEMERSETQRLNEAQFYEDVEAVTRLFIAQTAAGPGQYEFLRAQNEKAHAVLSKVFKNLEKNGFEGLVPLLKDLYLKALPHYLAGAKISPVHHIAHVMAAMEEIIREEMKRQGPHPHKARRSYMLIGLTAALMHDIGNAYTKLKKIRTSEIREIRDPAEREKKRQAAIDFRREHIDVGLPIAREIILSYEREHPGTFPENILQEIEWIITHHDDPTIAELVEDAEAKKAYLIRDFKNRRGRLLAYHREADRLWMLTPDGIEVDLQNDPASNFLEKMAGNIERHREEALMYRQLFPGIPLQNGLLYRTKTGYQIFERLAMQALVKHAKPSLILFAGPSGSGKSVFTQYLLDPARRDLGGPGVMSLRRTTTRKPRPGEEDHGFYRFLSPEEFRLADEDNKIYFGQENYGEFYGFHVRDLAEALMSGKILIIEALRSARDMKKFWDGMSLKQVGVIPVQWHGEMTESQRKEAYDKLRSRIANREEGLDKDVVESRAAAMLNQIPGLVGSSDLVLENISREARETVRTLEALSRTWKERAWDRRMGEFLQHFILAHKVYMRDGRQYFNVQYQVFNSVAETGNIEDRLWAWWIYLVHSVYHLRQFGVHVEKYREKDYRALDSQIIVDLLNRHFLPDYLRWREENQEKLVRNETAAVELNEAMLWALGLALDIRIYDVKNSAYKPQELSREHPNAEGVYSYDVAFPGGNKDAFPVFFREMNRRHGAVLPALVREILDLKHRHESEGNQAFVYDGVSPSLKLNLPAILSRISSQDRGLRPVAGISLDEWEDMENPDYKIRPAIVDQTMIDPYKVLEKVFVAPDRPRAAYDYLEEVLEDSRASVKTAQERMLGRIQPLFENGMISIEQLESDAGKRLLRHLGRTLKIIGWMADDSQKTSHAQIQSEADLHPGQIVEILYRSRSLAELHYGVLLGRLEDRPDEIAVVSYSSERPTQADLKVFSVKDIIARAVPDHKFRLVTPPSRSELRAGTAREAAAYLKKDPDLHSLKSLLAIELLEQTDARFAASLGFPQKRLADLRRQAEDNLGIPPFFRGDPEALSARALAGFQSEREYKPAKKEIRVTLTHPGSRADMALRYLTETRTLWIDRVRMGELKGQGILSGFMPVLLEGVQTVKLRAGNKETLEAMVEMLAAAYPAEMEKIRKRVTGETERLDDPSVKTEANAALVALRRAYHRGMRLTSEEIKQTLWGRLLKGFEFQLSIPAPGGDFTKDAGVLPTLTATRRPELRAFRFEDSVLRNLRLNRLQGVSLGDLAAMKALVDYADGFRQRSGLDQIVLIPKSGIESMADVPPETMQNLRNLLRNRDLHDSEDYSAGWLQSAILTQLYRFELAVDVEEVVFWVTTPTQSGEIPLYYEVMPPPSIDSMDKVEIHDWKELARALEVLETRPGKLHRLFLDGKEVLFDPKDKGTGLAEKIQNFLRLLLARELIPLRVSRAEREVENSGFHYFPVYLAVQERKKGKVLFLQRSLSYSKSAAEQGIYELGAARILKHMNHLTEYVFASKPFTLSENPESHARLRAAFEEAKQMLSGTPSDEDLERAVNRIAEITDATVKWVSSGTEDAWEGVRWSWFIDLRSDIAGLKKNILVKDTLKLVTDYRSFLTLDREPFLIKLDEFQDAYEKEDFETARAAARELRKLWFETAHHEYTDERAALVLDLQKRIPRSELRAEKPLDHDLETFKKYGAFVGPYEATSEAEFHAAWEALIARAREHNDADAAEVFQRWRSTPYHVLHGQLIFDSQTNKAGIIVGASGKGKSTLANHLTDTGFKHYADDEVIVFPHEGALYAFGNLKENPAHMTSTGSLIRIEETPRMLPLEFMIYLSHTSRTRQQKSGHAGRGLLSLLKTDGFHQLVENDAARKREILNLLGGLPVLTFGHASETALDYDDSIADRMEDEMQWVREWLDELSGGQPSLRSELRPDSRESGTREQPGTRSSELRHILLPQNPGEAATMATVRRFEQALETGAVALPAGRELPLLSREITAGLTGGIHATAKAVSRLMAITEDEAVALIAAQITGYDPENQKIREEIAALAKEIFGAGASEILFRKSAEVPLLQAPRIVSLEQIRDESNQLAIQLALAVQEQNAFLFYVTPSEGEDFDAVSAEVRKIEASILNALVLKSAVLSAPRRLALKVTKAARGEELRREMLKDVLSGAYGHIQPVVLAYDQGDEFLEAFPRVRNQAGYSLGRVKLDKELNLGEALLLMPAVSLGQNVVNMLQALEEKGYSREDIRGMIARFIQGYQKIASAA